MTWPHVTFQFGGRIDHTRYEPNGETDRNFTSGSGSVGLLLRPAAANDRLTVALSLARAARNPALEELFYFGPHPGNFAFEVGNPDLRPEHALGFDVSLRWRSPRASGEVTYFRNDISDYVFRSPLTEEEFESRLPEFAARFPGRGIGEEPIADRRVPDRREHRRRQRAAGHRVARRLQLDVAARRRSWGSTTCAARSRTPTSRCRAFRRCAFRGGLRYQRNAFQAGGEVTATAKQDRLFSTETPTDGYQLLRLYSVVLVRERQGRRTRSRRGSTTRPTSCIGITCR